MTEETSRTNADLYFNVLVSFLKMYTERTGRKVVLADLAETLLRQPLRERDVGARRALQTLLDLVPEGDQRWRVAALRGVVLTRVFKVMISKHARGVF